MLGYILFKLTFSKLKFFQLYLSILTCFIASIQFYWYHNSLSLLRRQGHPFIFGLFDFKSCTILTDMIKCESPMKQLFGDIGEFSQSASDV